MEQKNSNQAADGDVVFIGAKKSKYQRGFTISNVYVYRSEIQKKHIYVENETPDEEFPGGCDRTKFAHSVGDIVCVSHREVTNKSFEIANRGWARFNHRIHLTAVYAVKNTQKQSDRKWVIEAILYSLVTCKACCVLSEEGSDKLSLIVATMGGKPPYSLCMTKSDSSEVMTLSDVRPIDRNLFSADQKDGTVHHSMDGYSRFGHVEPGKWELRVTDYVGLIVEYEVIVDRLLEQKETCRKFEDPLRKRTHEEFKPGHFVALGKDLIASVGGDDDSLFMSVKRSHPEEEHKEPADCAASSTTSSDCICKMCMSQRMNMMFSPCNHVAVCEACSKLVESNGKRICPICRCEFTSVIKVFLA